MINRVFFASLFVLLSLCGDARGDKPEDYNAMPWHLVDVWWDFGKPSTFQSLAIDVTIKGEVADEAQLYIAPFGRSELNKQMFYGGIQTRTLAQTKKSPRRQDIGRGGIFSRWDERSHNAIRTAPGGYMESSGHEGDFVSVRKKMAWGEGRYTCRLVKLDTQWIDGKPFTWVGYFIYDHQRDTETYCGSLRFEGETLALDKNNAGFIELYGRRPASLDDIPKIEVIFHHPVLNGRPVELANAVAFYPQGVPDYAVARGVTDAETKSFDLHFKVGEKVERDKRQERLLK